MSEFTNELGISTNNKLFIRSIPLSIFHILFVIAAEIIIFLNLFDISINFILIPSIIFGFLAISFIFIRFEHRRIRVHGYIHLIENINLIAKIPAITSALGTMVLAILFHFVPSSIGSFSLTNLLQIIMSSQNLIILIFLFWYLILNLQHILRPSPPDANIWHDIPSSLSRYSLQNPSSPISSPRQLVKTQQRKINNLEELVSSRNHEINELKQRISFPNMNNPDSDESNLLLLKEQEIRHLTNERERLTRNLNDMMNRCETFRVRVNSMKQDSDKKRQELRELEQNIAKISEEKEKINVLLEIEQADNNYIQQTIEQLRHNIDEHTLISPH